MAENLCVGDCLDVDNDGRLVVVPDNQTIFCEDDGTGNGTSHLVAKGLDCDPWPYNCSTAVGGERVYCEDGLLYTLKQWNDYGVQGDFAELPNIVSLLQSPPGTIVREVCAPVTNNDPCGRDVCVLVHYNFNKNQIWVPPGAEFEIDYFAGIDGPGNYGVGINDDYFFNRQPTVERYHSGGTTNWTRRFRLGPGETQEICMKMQLGPDHEPGFDWNVGNLPNSIYGIYFEYQMTTDCSGWDFVI